MRSFVGLRRGGGGEMPGDDKGKITIMIMKETGVFFVARVPVGNDNSTFS